MQQQYGREFDHALLRLSGTYITPGRVQTTPSKARVAFAQPPTHPLLADQGQRTWQGAALCLKNTLSLLSSKRLPTGSLTRPGQIPNNACEIGTTGSTVMSNSGEYLSAWPRAERWCDPITPGSSNEAALRPESTAAKHAKNGRAGGVGVRGDYSAAEAAQDARNGAWLTAWPAGENWDVSSVSVSTP